MTDFYKNEIEQYIHSKLPGTMRAKAIAQLPYFFEAIENLGYQITHRGELVESHFNGDALTELKERMAELQAKVDAGKYDYNPDKIEREAVLDELTEHDQEAGLYDSPEIRALRLTQIVPLGSTEKINIEKESPEHGKSNSGKKPGRPKKETQ